MFASGIVPDFNRELVREKTKIVDPSALKEFTLYGEVIPVYSPVLQSYVPRIMNDFRKKYRREDEIYNQHLTPTSIYKAIDVDNSSIVVIKELRKAKMVNSNMHDFAKNELSIHYSLSNFTECENIVKVYEYFEDERAYYMVMECSPDPNFFEDLLENKYRPISDETTLKNYAADILNALCEIHKNNIVHCDIKPQNFLYFVDSSKEIKYENVVRITCNEKCDECNTSYSESGTDESMMTYDPNSLLKLTDFGLAHIIPSGRKKAFMKYKCGTFGYSAPEIGKDSFIDFSVDMWSFGVSLYQMAVAYMPTAIKQYKYGTGPIPFRKIDWNSFNFPLVRDLIESCLQMKPEDRISAADALQHPWFEADSISK